jgi:hypothetical protein
MCLILFVFKFYLENALEKKMKKILTHPSFGRSPTLSAPSPPPPRAQLSNRAKAQAARALLFPLCGH